MENVHPILYSFRRCPYAMRARMALKYAGADWEHREIVLRDKPAHMLEVSPKGSVPVLILPDGRIIDESLDIMIWALERDDPNGWLPDINRFDVFNLIERNDGTFKKNLDRYKYPSRYPDEAAETLREHARDNNFSTLNDINLRIKSNGALCGDKTTLADISIFPFIRQFAHVDRDWFYGLNMPNLHDWLKTHLNSPLFKSIMEKHPIWEAK